MNVLWIMCDQLRYDYLGCTGHPHIKTPNIDRVATEGVNFQHSYVQSTICGPSRMSAYTGRYVRSHGSATNPAPLRVGEPTLGDHLREIGVTCHLIGKTHMTADVEGMARLGIKADSELGVRVSECGFEPYLRDDGYHPICDGSDPEYFRHLRDHGYEAEHPWESWAISASDCDGTIVSGWFMRHAGMPARIPAHLSETAFVTDHAVQFLESRSGREPWVAHVSYIKPHWPYIAPAPYHNMYGSADVVPAIRNPDERDSSHPIVRAFQQERFSQAFSRDDVRDGVIPTYMGLITQIDDEIGRLITHLKSTGEYDRTMIIVSSDHGDYLGDHWLGEKMMFHDPSVRIPLIVRDPRPDADATRGSATDALVELIDIVPTILEYYGAEPKPHVLEGRSLLPLLEGRQAVSAWREAVFSEYDYIFDKAFRDQPGTSRQRKMRMVANHDWKLMHFEGFSPILIDRKGDPDEIHDAARRSEFSVVLADMHEILFRWARNPKSSICTTEAGEFAFAETQKSYDALALGGTLIGYWDERELDLERQKKAAAKTSSHSS